MKPIRGTGIIQMRNTLNFFLASSVFSSFVKIEKREKGVTGQKWFTFSSVQLPGNGGSESDETARLLL